MSNDKDYVEAGDYLEAKTNADATIHLKTVKIDGELALLNPFNSEVMDARFPVKTVEELNQHYKPKMNAYPTEIRTVDVTWRIGEKPVEQSLVAHLEHRIRQLI